MPWISKREWDRVRERIDSLEQKIGETKLIVPRKSLLRDPIWGNSYEINSVSSATAIRAILDHLNVDLKVTDAAQTVSVEKRPK